MRTLRASLRRLVIARAAQRCEYSRQTAPDPETGEPAPIYHPRQQRWEEHFRWDGVRVVGLTATGRATVAALDMNRAIILAIRAEEEWLGRHPP
jgi:hypothetical protein